jgi:hypothetical protein
MFIADLFLGRLNAFHVAGLETGGRIGLGAEGDKKANAVDERWRCRQQM